MHHLDVYNLITTGMDIMNNHYPFKLIYLNFHPLEVVSRCRDPQLQVGEKYSHLLNLRPNICKSRFFTLISFPITVMLSANKMD